MKTKRARHKTGRDKFSITFSIPKSQIDWLEEHKELNQSQLVSSLLGDYIETFNGVQPDAEKLVIKRRALQDQSENTEPKFKEAQRMFFGYDREYSRTLDYMQNIQYFAQLPLERITFVFDKVFKSDEVRLSAIDESGKTIHVNVWLKGLKEPQQVMATLQDELKKVQSEEYQAKLAELKRGRALAESSYNAYKQKHGNIKQQIDEIENILINGK